MRKTITSKTKNRSRRTKRNRKHRKKHRKKRTKKKAPRHYYRKRTRGRRRAIRRKKTQYGGNGWLEWKANFLQSIKSSPELTAAVKTWGTPPSKSLLQLYEEVKSGDSKVEFTEHGPRRVINVVQMKIYPSAAKKKQLKERKHFSPDDLTTPTKERDEIISEKIQGKEDPTAAAMRGISEELGADHEIKLLEPPQFRKETRTSSYSYPGLEGVYRYFLGKAIVKGLPNPAEHPTFQTTEYNKGGSKKRIIEWAWEDVKPEKAATAAFISASATFAKN